MALFRVGNVHPKMAIFEWKRSAFSNQLLKFRTLTQKMACLEEISFSWHGATTLSFLKRDPYVHPKAF